MKEWESPHDFVPCYNPENHHKNKETRSENNPNELAEGIIGTLYNAPESFRELGGSLGVSVKIDTR